MKQERFDLFGLECLWFCERLFVVVCACVKRSEKSCKNRKAFLRVPYGAERTSSLAHRTPRTCPSLHFQGKRTPAVQEGFHTRVRTIGQKLKNGIGVMLRVACNTQVPLSERSELKGIR